MAKPPCIALPFKVTAETDWVRPLRQYIARTLQDDPDAYADDCHAIQRMRQDMRGAKADETGKDIIFRYYSHLEALERRFRVGEQGVRTLFQWSDAFTGETTQQHALAFEKAGVIFNLAVAFAMQGATLLAESSSGSELDTIHTASIYFQVAADRLRFISKSFLHAPSLDLQQETVNVLDSIMMAQAQECALIRSRLENKKDVTLSKLAQQAAHMYGAIFDSLKAIADSHRLPRGWVLLMETKLRYYQAMAQYYEARSDRTRNRHGVAIARYSLAEQHAREATKLVGQFAETFFSTVSLTDGLHPESVQGLQDMIGALAASVAEELAAANHDNDVVYNDPVPTTATLPQLEAANVAAHFDINRFYASEERSHVVGGELFTRLVPMAVHEGASIYSEEKAKLLRAEEDKVNLADGELQDALSFMKLPDSLRRFDRRRSFAGASDHSGAASVASELVDPSRAVRDAAQDVQAAERTRQLADMRATVESQRARATAQLGDIRRILDDEQRASESALSDYASEPLFASYQPSSRAAAPFRDQVADNQKKLEDAAVLDSSILDDYRVVVAPWLATLQSGTDGVVSALYEHMKDMDFDDGAGSQHEAENLVDIGPGQPAGLAGQVQLIRDTYEQLLDLKKIRRSTLAEMKAFAQNDDISGALIKLSDAKALQPLFDRELRKYDGFIQRMQAAAGKQAVLVKRISDEYRGLLDLPQARAINKKWDAAEGKKSAVEAQVLKAVQVYNHVRDGLDKAGRFYGLLLEALEPLQRQTRDFAAARTAQREQLVKKILQDSAARNQAMLQERLSQYSATSSQPRQQYPPSDSQQQQHGYSQQQQQQQQYQQPMQQSYQSHGSYGQPPSARTADSYDVNQLAGQAARLTLGSPVGEPAQLPQMQQHSYATAAPQYQPNAPPPPQQQQQPQMHYAPPPPMQQQHQQHQQQYQPPPPQQYQPHVSAGQDYYADPGYQAASAAGQYGSAPNPYAPPPPPPPQRTMAEHPAVSGHQYQVHTSYAPAPAIPAQPASGPANGYGVPGAPSATYAASAHHPVYSAFSEPPAPVAAAAPAPAVHPATAQPLAGGYANHPAQGGASQQYNVHHQPGPQGHVSAPHQYSAPGVQTSPYQHPSVVADGRQQQQQQQQQRPAPHQYGVPAQMVGSTGSMGHRPPPQQQQQQQPYQQQPYQQQPYQQQPYHHSQQQQQQPLHQYGSVGYPASQQSPPPPAPAQQQAPGAYSYAYSTQQYAAVSAPYSAGPGMTQAPPPPVQSQPYGYGHPPAAAPQHQYQHGYGGNPGSLMD
ncbi:bck1-like resistance to osmotic shock [Coemansia javaensis]|uniref:BRO domain-containing protein 1 n=1 Tax=Coemansia javaensis TaxID=2761396 RepID=A0A9W8HB15_9FUNG|nr:bck1-like resistance to osmotic shock [Coemansia javaensis]